MSRESCHMITSGNERTCAHVFSRLAGNWSGSTAAEGRTPLIAYQMSLLVRTKSVKSMSSVFGGFRKILSSSLISSSGMLKTKLH